MIIESDDDVEDVLEVPEEEILEVPEEEIHEDNAGGEEGETVFFTPLSHTGFLNTRVKVPPLSSDELHIQWAFDAPSEARRARFRWLNPNPLALFSQSQTIVYG